MIQVEFIWGPVISGSSRNATHTDIPALGTPQNSKRAPQEAPGGSQNTVKDPPRPREHSKTTKRPPRRPQGPPKTLKRAPREAQENELTLVSALPYDYGRPLKDQYIYIYIYILETLRDTAASIRNRRGSCAGGKQEPAGTGRNRQEPAGTGGAGGIGMKFSGFLRILA